MVDGEIIQNVNAVATIKTGVITIKRNKKNPFSKDGSISYRRIIDTFENTVKIQVKEGVHQ